METFETGNRLLRGIAILALLGWGLSGCATDPAGAPCGEDEKENPITGECESTLRTGNGDAGVSTGSDGETVDPDSSTSQDDDGGTMQSKDDADVGKSVDVDKDDRCAAGKDSDGDGLDNKCECEWGTDPTKTDSDGDGILDNKEDADQDCDLDPGETDPRSKDTDGDGLDDKAEKNNGTDPLKQDTDGDKVFDGPEVSSGCMDPNKKDTDGDGILDGKEDDNRDGKLGTCQNRMYTQMCANGESDPCKKDTDGDGTNDKDEAAYLKCGQGAAKNVPTPKVVKSQSANYKLSVEMSVNAAAVSGVSAHAFTDGMHDYGGFIANLSTPSGAGNVEAIRDHVFKKVSNKYSGSKQRASGRRLSTHDGFQSVVGAVAELNGVSKVADARDAILAELAGVSSVSHSAGSSLPTAGSNDNVLFIYEVVKRSSGKYVIVGTTVLESDYKNNMAETGFRVDDLTGGASVAKYSQKLKNECVAYKVNNKPKVDFIWVLDGSGSMTDENKQVKNFANTFVNILKSSNLDWRLAVATGTCDDIANDPAISSQLKQEFGSGFGGTCPGVPLFNFPYKNGKLCDANNANFTKNASKFKNCINKVSGSVGGGEHTGTMGTAAIDRALPRSSSDPKKIRPGAAVVVVSLTDEFDEHVAAKMNWPDAQSNMNMNQYDPTQQSGFNSQKLDNVVKPFVDYYLKRNVGATMFGIYWIPGTNCPTMSAPEAPAGIHRMVTQTGGFAGSICQSTLQNTLSRIASAAAGIASGLRLRGTPSPQTIRVKVGPVGGMVRPSQRSRSNGFDYDAIVNRVTFNGMSAPKTNDKVVIAYKRWDSNIQGCMDHTDCPGPQKRRCIDRECL